VAFIIQACSGTKLKCVRELQHFPLFEKNGIFGIENGYVVLAFGPTDVMHFAMCESVACICEA
jgi:hypothetical protein